MDNTGNPSVNVLQQERRLLSRAGHCHYLYHNRFTAGPDYVITPHEHLFWHVEFVKAGLLESVVGGRRFESPTGYAILLPPTVPHGFVYRESGTTVFSVKFEVRDMTLPLRPVNQSPSPALESISAALDSLLPYQRWPSPARFAAVNHLLSAFVHVSAETDDTESSLGPPSICDKIKETVERAQGGPLTIRELSRELGFSASYLREQFLRHEGITLKEYIDRQRANIAVQYLSYSDIPIKQIVEKMGFPDPQCFSRFCRRLTGRSPREIRRTVLGGTNIRQVRR